MAAQQRQRVLLAVLVLACCSCLSQAWTSSGKAFRGRQTMYMPPNTPTSQPPNLVAQKMLKNPGNPRITESSTSSARSKSMKLSNSVLASCDTLPSFPTAHGLLSPEVVMRLDSLKVSRSPALTSFLDTYHREGPLSCLPMLSDPNVLPHLTQAMREIAA